jgi:recombination protein RecT
VPTAVTVEVVYSSDNFRPIKKGKETRVESYEFEITNAFDRGTIVGGFAYLEFADPTKNELIIMSMKDVEKRKPQYASANFWGGKKKEKIDWANGRRSKSKAGWTRWYARRLFAKHSAQSTCPETPRR